MKRYHQPYGWWGGHWGHTPVPLSLVQLVEAGTLDLRLAALLWLLVERKGSFIVASEPPLAGKTTLLTALIAMLPPSYEVVYPWGWREDFAWLEETQPQKTYIMVNEISDHLPTYLWGPNARRVFQALGRGYSLGAAMHDTTSQGVLGQLLSPPLSIPPGLVGSLHLVLILEMEERGYDVRRRVACADLVVPTASPAGPPSALNLAIWERKTDTICHANEEAPGRLASRLGLGLPALEEAVADKQAFLQRLLKAPSRDIQTVRAQVLRYYADRAAPNQRFTL